jgi:predicted GIY-YIG superfamily endonuclease
MCAQPMARGRPRDPTGAEWQVYCLITEAPGSEAGGFRTYIGITKNMARRLDQHNGLLAGGAKSTRATYGTWAVLHIVKGFGEDKSAALRFEYAWKHAKSNSRLRSPENRTEILYNLLREPQWSHLHQEGVHCVEPPHVAGATGGVQDM